MKASVVVGLGYGDEGKGLMTSLIASKYGRKALVVRFNGGHQAGHTVVKDNARHVFSNFGAGTLDNADTYWSQYCTFDPIGAMNELRQLTSYKMGLMSLLCIHPLCPVVTPFDKLWNMNQARLNGHGSVGVGFGATIDRHEKYFKLHAQDLLYKDVLHGKIKSIANYYAVRDLLMRITYQEAIDKFMSDTDKFRAMQEDAFIIAKPKPSNYDHVIFEGAQGIMLDMDYGFFPNVTRSNTTSKNAIEMMNRWGMSFVEIYYMTRAYSTRHGNGFFTGEDPDFKLKNNQDETNVKNEFQGEFRLAPLNLDSIEYAIRCDNHHSGGIGKKNIVITCMDQVDNDRIPLIEKGQLTHVDAGQLSSIAPLYRYPVHFNADAKGNTYAEAKNFVLM